jgi:hypothetical protein
VGVPALTLAFEWAENLFLHPVNMPPGSDRPRYGVDYDRVGGLKPV